MAHWTPAPPRKTPIPRRRPVYAASKRALDIVASGLGLLVASPILALAAVAVKLDSRGPIFFRQKRVGRHFREFEILKFRTMVADAPARGGQLTFGADPRITRVGRWLRKSKLDELPQLVNVLVGDMSLVGPRPEVPAYVELYRQDYERLLAVRPGLTDPSSIKYRDESALLAASADPHEEYVRRILPDKIAISEQYLAQASFFSDLAVFARTLLRIAR